MLGPHTHTPAPTARGWRTPTARPMGRQSGEGQRLTSDAPHNGERHPPQGRRPARAHAVGTVLVPNAHTDRTRDTRVAEPRLRASEDGRPGEGQHLTPDAPHNGGRPPPPKNGPPPAPQHAAPTGHAGQGDSGGPPHPHTRAHSMWVTDPNSPPSGRAVGGGTAPDLRRPSQWRKASPPGTPFRHPHCEQRRPARAHAVGPVLVPHARTDRTRDTRVAEPRPPAAEEGRPGEAQRLTPDAPHNGGRPPPPGTAPHHPRGTQPPQGMQNKGIVLGPRTLTAPPSTWVADPNSPPSGRAVGGGTAPDLRRPSQWWKASPPGTPIPPPPQGATPARKGACCGTGAGSPRPHRPHPGHTGRGTPAARSRGRAAGGGTAPDTRRPSQRWDASPPGDGPPTTPAASSPHRACLYFCRCPCFPDACPCFLFICLLTCGLCLPGMSHPSQSSGSFSALQTTEFCPISFNFITPFKLLHLLFVAQQYLIAICHSLLAIGASLGSALHPGKFTVA